MPQLAQVPCHSWYTYCTTAGSLTTPQLVQVPYHSWYTYCTTAGSLNAPRLSLLPFYIFHATDGRYTYRAISGTYIIPQLAHIYHSCYIYKSTTSTVTMSLQLAHLPFPCQAHLPYSSNVQYIYWPSYIYSWIFTTHLYFSDHYLI